MTRMDENTQTRIIRAEVTEVCASIRDAIKDTGQEIKRDLKDEMHTHFATKLELQKWRLETYKETEAQIKGIVQECESRHSGKWKSKPSKPPAAPKQPISNKKIAQLVSAIVALGGGVWALVELLTGV